MERRTVLTGIAASLFDFWPFNRDSGGGGGTDPVTHDELEERLEKLAGAHLTTAGDALAVSGGDWVPSNLSWESVSLSFGESRVPSNSRPTLVNANVAVESTGGNAGVVLGQLDVGDGTGYSKHSEWRANVSSGSLTGVNDVRIEHPNVIMVPAGATYKLINDLDPAGANVVDFVKEMRF